MPYTSPIDVFLILTRGDEVLLALRENTGHSDGLWNFPSGKLDADEPADAAMCREALEEVGLTITPADLGDPHVLHYRSPDTAGRLGLFFHVEYHERFGEPVNAEPHKCAGLEWFPAHEPAPGTDPYNMLGWRLWRSGRGFAPVGW